MTWIKNKTGIFPGTFNPFHPGHLDVIKKAIRNGFKEIYVVIAQNPNKSAIDLEYNRKLVECAIDKLPYSKYVKVLVCDGLLAEFAKDLDVRYIIRGYRNSKDKKYERKLFEAYLNTNPNLKFKLYKATKRNRNLSSTLLKKKLKGR